MAMTGYYKTLVRPRQHHPLSMLKYDPVGTSAFFPPIISCVQEGSEKAISPPRAEAGGGVGNLYRRGRERVKWWYTWEDVDYMDLRRCEKKKKKANR